MSKKGKFCLQLSNFSNACLVRIFDRAPVTPVTGPQKFSFIICKSVPGRNANLFTNEEIEKLTSKENEVLMKIDEIYQLVSVDGTCPPFKPINNTLRFVFGCCCWGFLEINISSFYLLDRI